MLTVTDLYAGYAGAEVLHAVSLEVKEGEAVVIPRPQMGTERPPYSGQSLG